VRPAPQPRVFTAVSPPRQCLSAATPVFREALRERVAQARLLQVLQLVAHAHHRLAHLQESPEIDGRRAHHHDARRRSDGLRKLAHLCVGAAACRKPPSRSCRAPASISSLSLEYPGCMPHGGRRRFGCTRGRRRTRCAAAAGRVGVWSGRASGAGVRHGDPRVLVRGEAPRAGHDAQEARGEAQLGGDGPADRNAPAGARAQPASGRAAVRARPASLIPSLSGDDFDQRLPGAA